jgi:hypothetical protein
MTLRLHSARNWLPKISSLDLRGGGSPGCVNGRDRNHGRGDRDRGVRDHDRYVVV